MFNGLLKTKFYSKCKTAIKLTKTRIEIIKRKRSAMQKYLKNDVVDLLKNGLDTNAYGRVEGLWNELNLSSCYDYIEQCCTHISSHLATMDKQKECPEECREAVSSLMFAAARFSDLPELRELRTVFTGRFGNSIEFYVNKEFVQKLKSTPPTKDMKLQLMHDITLQFGIEWNEMTLEQKLNKNPPASAPGWTKDGTEDKSNSPNWMDNANQKTYNKGPEYKHEDPLKYSSSERETGKDVGDGGQNPRHISCREAEDMTPIKDIQVDRIDRKVPQNESHTVSASDEENNEKKPFYYKSIRPPYTISKVSITNSTSAVPPNGSDTKGIESIQRSGQNGESEEVQQDDAVVKPKPKPKSVRRRNLKTWPGKDKVENSGYDGSETMSSKDTKQGGGKEGRQHLKISNDRQHDQLDEEERIMDRLLMHYSRKKLPHDTGEPEAVIEHSPPTRVASLLAESSPTEARRIHARASSFQPEVLNSNGHVHPKLPEYEDFVARLAALRANSKK